jgi:hypothetical protein
MMVVMGIIVVVALMLTTFAFDVSRPAPSSESDPTGNESGGGLWAMAKAFARCGRMMARYGLRCILTPKRPNSAMREVARIS